MNTRLNLVLVRLACCCGLRASEIAKLQVGDVRTDIARPHIRIRSGSAKGGRSRIVPLWWDAGTLNDLAAWRVVRIESRAAVTEDRSDSGRQVALKTLLKPGDAKADARFRREIQALGRGDHPHVVKLFTSGSHGDRWFYTMELIEGADLATVCE